MHKLHWPFGRLSPILPARPMSFSLRRSAAGVLAVLVFVAITGFRSIVSGQP